jgi:4-amino-4-deoxy-L-arabinose transferase-like glycosyltransferase
VVQPLALAKIHPRLTLTLFCLLLWLPGLFTLPPGDRDESRFAQASKQMLETGNFVEIRNGAEARNRKPIGIHWLQLPGVAAARAIGLSHDNPIWPFRLPSVAGGLLAVLAVHGLGGKLFGTRAALLAAAMLAACAVLTVEVHIAKTDAALLGATTLAMLLLAEAYLTGRLSAGRAALFWIAFGVGVLLKGPITPLVVGLAVATLVIADRRARWLFLLRPAWGVPLALAVVLPWFVAIGLATHGAFFREAVGGDLGNKLAGGEDAHGAPPLYHLLLLSLTLFPSGWAILLALPSAWAARREQATRFLLAWAGPAWLVFEAVPTKLPHYPLPLAPALCLIAARWLLAPRPAPRWLVGAAGLLSAVAVAVLGLAPAALPFLLHDAVWLGVPALAAAAVLAALMLSSLWRGDMLVAALRGLLAAVPLYAAILWLELPSLSALWIAPRVAAALAAHGPVTGFASAGFAEPSLVFLCGTDTTLVPGGAQAAQFLADAPGRAVLVARRDLPAFQAEVARLAIAPHLFSTVDGFNYSNGRWVRLMLFDRN